MPSFLRLPALAWLLLAAVLAGPAPAAAFPLAERGRLVLDEVPAEPVPLGGEWGFAWSRFVDPGWQELPVREFAPVPMPWNEVEADGKPPGEDGFGTYLLLLDCPAGRSLAIDAIGQRTASRLYVNGTLVAGHGRTGTTPGSTRAAVHTRIPVTQPFPCPLHITLHVANFEHRAGGFVRPLLAGTPDVLARDREERVGRHAALLAAYLLTALASLIFYVVRHRERTPLAYGLFCITMAIYADMTGERLFLRPLGGQLGWIPYMRIEYLSWIAAMALFLLTLHGLFPGEVRRRPLTVVLGVLGAAALAVLVLPPGVYSYLAQPGQAAAVGVAVYFAALLMRAHARNPFDVRVLVFGLAAVVATLVVDLVLIDTPRPDRKFAPLGFAVFLLSPAMVLARRLSHALNAEERTRTLEENARLRDDVERMSRHDLKTPINSILGASRLLAESGRLDADQRDLVGVVQRAALRMLEMVNLSLGLLRMEQGRYELRPTAVNLQDVVTRVLVDLQDLAQQGGVALHVRGSARAAVLVRAEELLCYSIVSNIVKNAIEATPAGGRVTLELRRTDPVTLSVHNPAQVPPEIVADFFGKYVTYGKRGGTGLGTYSARMMARVQHGDLVMHTGEAGTTLTLSLPAADSALAAARPVTVVSPFSADWPQDGRVRSVLVVDDDEFSRMLHRRFLPSPPFAVETAANGRDAQAAMARRWPHFLVLDMEMPVQDGLQTLHWVRRQEAEAGKPRCAVVMLSGNDDEVSEQRAMAAGADRYLTKPVSREALLTALRELAAQEGTAPPAKTAWRRAQDAAPPPPAGPAPDPEETVRIHPEWVAYFPKFVRSQRATLVAMERMLAAGDRKQLEFLAHRAFGGLSAMGLHWAAGEMRDVEHQAHEAPAEALQRRIAMLRDYLDRVRWEPDQSAGKG